MELQLQAPIDYPFLAGSGTLPAQVSVNPGKQLLNDGPEGSPTFKKARRLSQAPKAVRSITM
jgi:hypothetical protein